MLRSVWCHLEHIPRCPGLPVSSGMAPINPQGSAAKGVSTNLNWEILGLRGVRKQTKANKDDVRQGMLGVGQWGRGDLRGDTCKKQGLWSQRRLCHSILGSWRRRCRSPGVGVGSHYKAQGLEAKQCPTEPPRRRCTDDAGHCGLWSKLQLRWWRGWGAERRPDSG